MKLSEHFDSREFACHCGCGAETVTPALVDSLEVLRELIGVPIGVLSGRRCVAHNARMGGTPDSRHLSGEAADIRTDIPLTTLLRAAEKVPRFLDGGIGIYPHAGFLHVDVRGGLARWGFLGGKYVAFSPALAMAQLLEKA